MRYPRFLQKNGSIGIIAPSFGCTHEPYISLFKAAEKRFAGMGYSMVLGPNCFKEDGIGKSTSPKNCGDEINDFFINDRSDVIISMGGGETMCEDLPFVDFEGIAKAPAKWYLGYSDNTNLTFTLPTLCDTAAVYGPCAATFGMKEWHPAISDAFSILTGEKLTVHNYDGWELESLKGPENPFAPLNITEPFRLTGVNCGGEETKFSGRLIGGCLDCLITLLGTRFDKVKEFSGRYAQDGIIWFIEACDLNVMGIRRALWQMENAGWFKNAAGFIIGRPMHYDEPMFGSDRHDAVTSVLGKYGLPIVMDVDLGHLPPMMPIISGACCDVTVGRNSIELSYILK